MMWHCHLYNNSADNGGGIHAAQSSPVTAYTSMWEMNHALNQGGGVMADAMTTVTLTECTFKGNMATDGA
eukprot:3633926-Rhodomonas_salina.1